MQQKKQVALELLAALAQRKIESITPEMELVADLGLDSPKAVQLLVELEDRLEIEIGDEEASRMNTVADVLGYLGE